MFPRPSSQYPVCKYSKDTTVKWACTHNAQQSSYSQGKGWEQNKDTAIRGFSEQMSNLAQVDIKQSHVHIFC